MENQLDEDIINWTESSIGQNHRLDRIIDWIESLIGQNRRLDEVSIDSIQSPSDEINLMTKMKSIGQTIGWIERTSRRLER